jgi:type I restriction enzyme S subunit
MSEGWAQTALGSICRFQAGDAFGRNEQGRSNGDHPFIKVSDMNLVGNELHIARANNWISDEEAQRKYRLHPKDAVVFAKIGIALTYNRRRRLTRPAAIDNNMMSAVCLPEFDPIWFYYLLSTIDFNLISSGSALPYLTVKDLSRISVEVPSTKNQKAIASVLGALDDKIELNRRMIETLEATTRAIFKDWFVYFGPTRAKMEGSAPYLSPDIWSVFPGNLDPQGKPKGWNSEAVYEQAIWVNGAAYKDMHFSSEPDALPVVKIAELKSGITKTTRFTKTDLGERYKIRDGELLFSWSGNPDTSIDTFVWTSGTAWLNQHIFAVRPNGKRSQAFLYAMLKFLRSDFAEIARNKQTTGLGHVTQQDLIRLKITAPSPEAAAAFDEIVGPLHARFTSNLFENQSLVSIRDFLLPKLMSGEVRVRDAEKLVGDAT